MSNKFLITLFLIFSIQILHSQEWHKREYREKNFSASEYYSQYIEYNYNKDKSNGENISYVLDIAKNELSKKIISDVQGESNLSSRRSGDVYNSVFNSNSKITTSATFSDLQILESFIRKKSVHIFVYIKKEDFKILTKSRYEDLLNSIFGELNACIQMYSDKSYSESKAQGDLIDINIKKLKRLKNLLSVFDIEYDPLKYNSVIETFQPLYAKIKKHISDEQNYLKNKEQGDLNSLSNIYTEIEKAIIFYKKSEKINPKQALEDGIPDKINAISIELFKIYCQNALNYEQESKYYDAVNFYKKARLLFPAKKVSNVDETTTERIIICQDNLIEILISQGDEEFDDSPTTALSNYRKAKDLISSMNRNDRIKEINKLILKAEKQIQKDNKKQLKIYRKQKIKDQRNISPHRILFSFGGGFQNSFIDNSDIFSEPISIDVDMWHLSSTLGYRLNLPDEIKTTKTGFEKSKGNVIAIFYKQGNTITKFNNTNFESSFNEIEFGYILKERIRLSLGKGSRSISNNNNIIEASSIPTNYNCATGSFYMHFGRLSLETSITYLLSDKFAFEEAKLNANLSIRFYFYKKIYKTVKENIN